MKIKTNIRAGAGGSTAVDTSASSAGQVQAGKGGVNSNKINNTVVSYIPPVGRCVGI